MDQSTRFLRLLVAVVVLAVVAVGCADDDAGEARGDDEAEASVDETEPSESDGGGEIVEPPGSSEPEPPEPAAPEFFMASGGVTPFYEWSDPVPTSPGELLRSEPLEAEFSLANAGTAHRVLYSSTGWSGDPTVVSGAVFLPPGDAPDGGWPVLAWSHGTVGIADVCAPSANPRGERDTRYLNHWLAEGYAVVATDYEGLGTGGTHPYLHGRSEGNGNVDLVRAVQDLGENLSTSWLVLGQSQGGQGSLSTGALAAERAPELDFKGTLATAPAVQLVDLLDTSGANPDDGMPFLGFVALLMVGMDTYSDEFTAADTLTEEAGAILPLVEEACSGDLIDEGIAMGLTLGETFTTELQDAPGIDEAIPEMEIPFTDAWSGQPVFIGQGTADQLLDWELAPAMMADLCALGAEVTLVVYEDASHSGPMNDGLGEITPWVAARFADEPVADACVEIRVPAPPG